MRSLVIGGRGFIGAHVVKALLRAGIDVVSLDRGRVSTVDEAEGPRRIVGSISDPLCLDHALSGVDTVFHLASTTVPSTSNASPMEDVVGNLNGTLNVLEAMRRANVNRIVYFSSGGTVYGDSTDSPIREDCPLNPICSYGVVKVAIEKYLYMYQKLYGLQPLIIRPSNPYGPGQSFRRAQGVIPAVALRMSKNLKIEIWGDGSIIRDYIYIDDVVSFVMQAAYSGITGVYNVGSGKGHTLTQVVNTISSLGKWQADIIYKPARSFDVQSVVLDIQKASSDFSWRPLTSFEDGVQAYLSRFEESTLY